jgi:hypothetical protein
MAASLKTGNSIHEWFDGIISFQMLYIRNPFDEEKGGGT